MSTRPTAWRGIFLMDLGPGTGGCPRSGAGCLPGYPSAEASGELVEPRRAYCHGLRRSGRPTAGSDAASLSR